MIKFSKTELRERLQPIEYSVTQEKGTERANSGKYNKFFEDGLYCCIVCKNALFGSDAKYDSKSGWPAFYRVLDESKIKLSKDASAVCGNLLLLLKNPELVRTAIACSRCGAHLGHLFEDGPKPTGKRYCVNSAALQFKNSDEPVVALSPKLEAESVDTKCVNSCDLQVPSEKEVIHTDHKIIEKSCTGNNILNAKMTFLEEGGLKLCHDIKIKPSRCFTPVGTSRFPTTNASLTMPKITLKPTNHSTVKELRSKFDQLASMSSQPAIQGRRSDKLIYSGRVNNLSKHV